MESLVHKPTRTLSHMSCWDGKMQTGDRHFSLEIRNWPFGFSGTLFHLSYRVFLLKIKNKKIKITFNCSPVVLRSVPETHLGPLLWSTDDGPGDQWKPRGGPKRCRRRLRFLQECAEKGCKSHSGPSCDLTRKVVFQRGSRS